MYELLFWNYKEGVYLNHHEVYEAIEDNQIIDGLEEIQTEVIINRVNSVFSNWERIDKNSRKNPSGKGAFQILSASNYIKIDCYGTEGKIMDLIVNTLEEFKLSLYDPQIPVRYDEFNE